MSIVTLPFLVVQPTKPHTATVICVHGIGDDGRGWIPLTNELASALPHVKWVLPHAPQRPITVYNKEWLRAWFDIPSFSFTETEDAPGMSDSVRKLDALVKAEVDAGIPQERIVLSGFSQGGAIVLLSGLGGRAVREGGEPWKLAGVAVMSGWLPLRDRFKSLISPHALTMPVFWGHGTDDPLVRYSFGRKSAEILKDQVGLALRWGDKGEAERAAFGSAGVSFLGYNGVLHAACSKERADLKEFLKRVIPDNHTG